MFSFTTALRRLLSFPATRDTRGKGNVSSGQVISPSLHFSPDPVWVLHGLQWMCSTMERLLLLFLLLSNHSVHPAVPHSLFPLFPVHHFPTFITHIFPVAPLPVSEGLSHALWLVAWSGLEPPPTSQRLYLQTPPPLWYLPPAQEKKRMDIFPAFLHFNSFFGFKVYFTLFGAYHIL